MPPSFHEGRGGCTASDPDHFNDVLGSNLGTVHSNAVADGARTARRLYFPQLEPDSYGRNESVLRHLVRRRSSEKIPL